MFKIIILAAIVFFILKKKGVIKRKDVNIEIPSSFNGCTNNYDFVKQYYQVYKALDKEEESRKKAISSVHKGSNSTFDKEMAIMREFSDKRFQLNKAYEDAVECHVAEFKKSFDNILDRTICSEMCSAKLDEVDKLLLHLCASKYNDKLRKALEKACDEVKEQVEIATCQHQYTPVYSPYYKENLFQEVNFEGYELLRCSKCSHETVGNKITDKFSCGNIGEQICTDILYGYNGEVLKAGKYTVDFTPYYLVANRRAPKLEIEKGDRFILLYCDDYKIEKNNDYPLGLDIITYLNFVDENGDLLKSGALDISSLDNIRSKDDIDREVNERFGPITANTTHSEIEDMVSTEFSLRRESNLVLLRVPNTTSFLELTVLIDSEDDSADSNDAEN